MAASWHGIFWMLFFVTLWISREPFPWGGGGEDALSKSEAILLIPLGSASCLNLIKERETGEISLIQVRGRVSPE